MANIKEIRDRINSVNDTRKITNAMYLISSTKLRKAKKMLDETEPFFFATQAMISRVVRHLPEGVENVFLESRSEIPEQDRRRGYIVFTDDKGLAGAYNHNVIKLAEEHILNDGDKWKLFVIGEVGRYHFLSKNMDVEESFMFTSQNPTLHRARKIAAEILDYYTRREIDEFYCIYTTVHSNVCETRFEKLLPLDIITNIRKEKPAIGTMLEEFLMEPSPSAILDNIVPNYVTGYIYGALVEAFCSVQSSRMMAMDSANKNAAKMLDALQRTYNRQRQAMITQEITEVASGAKALKRAKLAKMQKSKKKQMHGQDAKMIDETRR
ncbi:ATP synthase F1 gamma subunit AtpG2 [Butyrivibrio proteoclasticus B316]|uniref:ATP synthase gamma chain n=1 Tax=Butyrivibrio proteoclasticus (strain ATCC 51982 / DSM 14932 / B316) TaxID=515622 RepID=E0S276_BUTPB|nr:ATP synthase F1 subunit gamma [Butyrivibrio proteoclasticus]ADL33901.1 ATP synthase F1 gamma subunit AtpG2 [Butyrivibrio proteoclasticus B316]